LSLYLGILIYFNVHYNILIYS